MAVFSKRKLEEIQARDMAPVHCHTVMIVDDEEANRAVMAAILRPHYQLIEACDGLHALRLIEQLDDAVSLACIVSDQRMPNLTGVELFQRVQPLLPLTVRIIVTGYVDVGSIVDSINKAEIYRFIVKPFDAHDFLLTVRRGVESYDMQRQLSEFHADLARQVRIRTEELEQSQASLIRANQVLKDEIAERQRAQAALQKSAGQILALYNNASCGYHALDRDGVFTHINDTELAWLGRARDEVVGKMTLPSLLAPSSWAALRSKFPDIEQHGWTCDLRDIELELVANDGTLVPVLANAVALVDDGVAVCRFTVFDITERSEELERVRYLASHDALTGLPNRALMVDRLERDLLQAVRYKHRAALMFIDLDGFKGVNDTLGHDAGDQLLQQVGARLLACVRQSDSVARFGGDEFVIGLAQLVHTADVATVAHKILEELSRVFVIGGREVHISGSIGASVFPDDGHALEVLMRFADEAMYRSKAQGRNCFHSHQGDGTA